MSWHMYAHHQLLPDLSKPIKECYPAFSKLDEGLDIEICGASVLVGGKPIVANWTPETVMQLSGVIMSVWSDFVITVEDEQGVLHEVVDALQAVNTSHEGMAISGETIGDMAVKPQSLTGVSMPITGTIQTVRETSFVSVQDHAHVMHQFENPKGILHPWQAGDLEAPSRNRIRLKSKDTR